MHDSTVVVQNPSAFWFDGRPKASPHNQWVVKSIATADSFAGGTPSITTQKYRKRCANHTLLDG
jgi:hypothetical protein